MSGYDELLKSNTRLAEIAERLLARCRLLSQAMENIAAYTFDKNILAIINNALEQCYELSRLEADSKRPVKATERPPETRTQPDS